MSESDNNTPTGPSIANSLANAQHQVWEAEQEPLDMPKPLEADNVDHEKAKKVAEKADKRTREQRKVDDRRDTIRKAFQTSKDKDKEKEKGKGKTVSDDWVEDRKLRRGILEKHASAQSDKPSDKDLTTKEAREHRQALRAKYPGADLGKVFAAFEAWDEAFKKDPVATRQMLLDQYLKTSPENFAKAKPREYQQGVRGSIERAREDQRDLEELAPHIEKHGSKFTHFMRQLVELDAAMTNDPVGTSARLAANYGALNAPAKQAHQQPQEQPRPIKPLHERTPEEDFSNVYEAVGRIVESRDHPSVAMPGIENEDVLNGIADALTNGAVKRTADRMADLRAAYALVMKSREDQQAEQQRSIERGSKSIVGVPSTTVPAARSSRPIQAAVSRAMGQL
jgi:hypothetical protein